MLETGVRKLKVWLEHSCSSSIATKLVDAYAKGQSRYLRQNEPTKASISMLIPGLQTGFSYEVPFPHDGRT